MRAHIQKETNLLPSTFLIIVLRAIIRPAGAEYTQNKDFVFVSGSTILPDLRPSPIIAVTSPLAPSPLAHSNIRRKTGSSCLNNFALEVSGYASAVVIALRGARADAATPYQLRISRDIAIRE